MNEQDQLPERRRKRHGRAGLGLMERNEQLRQGAVHSRAVLPARRQHRDDQPSHHHDPGHCEELHPGGNSGRATRCRITGVVHDDGLH